MPKTMCSNEIQKLTVSNIELIEQLKTFNKQLDLQVSKMKSYVQLPQPDPEVLLSSQIESAKKQLKNYEKEAERIKSELSTKTGYEKVMSLESQLAAAEKLHNGLQQTINQLHKKIAVSAKELDQYQQKKTAGVFQAEEKAALVTLNKAREKMGEFEKQIKAMVEGQPAVEAKIKETREVAEGLEKEIEVLKKEAKVFAKNNGVITTVDQKVESTKGAAQVAKEIEKVKAEIETVLKKSKDDLGLQEQTVTSLKEQLKNLETVPIFHGLRRSSFKKQNITTATRKTA